MYAVLPVKQKKYIEKNVQAYLESLDASIARILRPSVGKTEDSLFLVSDEQIPLYGTGKTLNGAMDDYRSAVIEYYEDLEKDADELNAQLKHQLDILRQVFGSAEKVL